MPMFEEEVNAIANKYSLKRQNEIIFYGASNFRMWTDLEDDLSEYKVQNHGFGGCTDKDLLENADRILYPYHPSLVFFQTGSNDYVDQTGTEHEIAAACMAYKKKMFDTVYEKLPEAKLVVMSGLLLPGRSRYASLTMKINDKLRKYCDSPDYMYFVDTTSMTYDGKDYDTSLFLPDGMHLNREGQRKWCKEYIKPQIDALVREYDLFWLRNERSK